MRHTLRQSHYQCLRPEPWLSHFSWICLRRKKQREVLRVVQGGDPSAGRAAVELVTAVTELEGSYGIFSFAFGGMSQSSFDNCIGILLCQPAQGLVLLVKRDYRVASKGPIPSRKASSTPLSHYIAADSPQERFIALNNSVLRTISSQRFLPS